jgi:hypothetical protein
VLLDRCFLPFPKRSKHDDVGIDHQTHRSDTALNRPPHGGSSSTMKTVDSDSLMKHQRHRWAG